MHDNYRTDNYRPDNRNYDVIPISPINLFIPPIFFLFFIYFFVADQSLTSAIVRDRLLSFAMSNDSSNVVVGLCLHSQLFHQPAATSVHNNNAVDFLLLLLLLILLVVGKPFKVHYRHQLDWSVGLEYVQQTNRIKQNSSAGSLFVIYLAAD